jgi:hypothetical protein
MPICKSCGEEFPDSYNYKASIGDFSKRKYCVKCRPVGAAKPNRHTNRREISECLVCSKPLSGRQTKFCSVECKIQLHASYPKQKDRAIIKKLRLIELAGGACSICGYNKNITAFHFHHLDPSKKSIQLHARAISKNGWDTVIQEFENCILLCANCHAEMHHPDMDYEKLKKDFEGVDVG